MYSPEYLETNSENTNACSHMDTQQSAKTARLLADVARVSPTAIADFGCGTGEHVLELVAQGWSAVGLELEETLVRHLNATHPAEFLSVRDAENSGLTFDMILMNDVLEHVPRPRESLDMAGQMLTAHGYLRIDSPLEGSKNLLERSLRLVDLVKRASVRQMTPYHIHQFELRSLVLLLEEQGFEVDEVQKYSVNWPGPSSLSVAWRQGIRATFLYFVASASRVFTAARIGQPNRVIVIARLRTSAN